MQKQQNHTLAMSHDHTILVESHDNDLRCIQILLCLYLNILLRAKSQQQLEFLE